MTSGVLFAWPEWSDTTADAFFTTRSHPDEQDARLREENEAMGMHFGSRLGKEYVRAPRWGTYLSKAWLDRIGGVDAIRRAVEPAAIRELGGEESLVFVQLTASPADALGPAADAKRIALRRLMKPILPTPFLA